jgi:hypothetical protein
VEDGEEDGAEDDGEVRADEDETLVDIVELCFAEGNVEPGRHKQPTFERQQEQALPLQVPKPA